MSIFSAVKNAIESIGKGAPAPQDVLSDYSKGKLAIPSTPAVQRIPALPPATPVSAWMNISDAVNNTVADIGQGIASKVAESPLSYLVQGKPKDALASLKKSLDPGYSAEDFNKYTDINNRYRKDKNSVTPEEIAFAKEIGNKQFQSAQNMVLGYSGSLEAVDQTIVDLFAKTRKPIVIEGKLRELNVPEQQIRSVTPLLVEAQTPGEVKAALRYVDQTTPKSLPPYSDQNPLALEERSLQADSIKTSTFNFDERRLSPTELKIFNDELRRQARSVDIEELHKDMSIGTTANKAYHKILEHGFADQQMQSLENVIKGLRSIGYRNVEMPKDFSVYGPSKSESPSVIQAMRQTLPNSTYQRIGQGEPNPYKTKYKGTDLPRLISGVIDSVHELATRKSLVQKLLKEGTEDGAVKILMDAGYPRGISRYYRTEFADAKNEKAIRSILEDMNVQLKDDHEFALRHGIEPDGAEMFTDPSHPLTQTSPTLEKPLELPQRGRYRKQPGLPTGTVLPHVELPAYNSIVAPNAGSVKQKVHIFDYLKTPEEVLQKVGLGKEAQMLRAADDNTTKQIAENFKFLQDLRAQVPGDESSDIIARYLDGQRLPRTMSPEELKVGHVLKNYYALLADKLGLPPNKRISEYFPHMFEKGDVEVEFDPQIARAIDKKIPGSVYDPFLQERKGKKGYILDVWRTTDAYTKRALRKFNFDPVLKQIAKRSEALDTYSAKYIKRYLDNVNMRPSELDEGLDNFIKSTPIGYKFGQRPTTVLLGKFRRLVSMGSLGLNFGSALRNLTQVVNTYAELGEKYTSKGYMGLFRNGVDELKEQGLLANNLITDRTAISTKPAEGASNVTKTKGVFDVNDSRPATEKVLFSLFDKVEQINRGAAYWGAKAKAIDAGLSESLAKDFAKKAVRKTQFVFGRIDTPVAIAGDIMKTAAQFQSFNLKQGEFLINKLKEKDVAGLVRWLGSSILVLYTIGKLFGMKWSDLIPTIGVANSPAATLLGGVADQLSSYGPTRAAGLTKIKGVGAQLIPGGVQVKKTYQGLQKAAKNFPGDVVQYIRGGTFGAGSVPAVSAGLGQTDRATAQSDKTATAKKLRERVQPTYDKVQAIKDSDPATAKALVDGLSDTEYEAYKQIKTAAKTKDTNTLKDRMFELYKNVQKLKDAGRLDEAQQMVDSLSDAEYKQYQAVKKLYAP